jgi:hypothetical protein
MSQATKSTPETAPSAPEAAEPAVLQVPFRPLPTPRLKVLRSSESDFGNQFGAVTSTGTPFEHVLRPDFWSLHAMKLRVGDTIEIHTDDQTYFGRLLVRSVDGTGANKTRASVAQLELHHFDQLERNDAALTHKVEHRGPHLKWSVIRIADGKVVKDGYESKEGAEGALRALTRPVAA